MLPPLSVWFKEKGCGKAPEGVSLGPSAEPWPQSHKNRIKERRRSDLRNGFRALPDAPDQQRTSGPARAIVEIESSKRPRPRRMRRERADRACQQ